MIHKQHTSGLGDEHSEDRPGHYMTFPVLFFQFISDYTSYFGAPGYYFCNHFVSVNNKRNHMKDCSEATI